MSRFRIPVPGPPPGGPPTGSGPSAGLYHTRRDTAAARRHTLARRASRLANIRFLAFAAAIGALVWAELRPDLGGLAFSAFILALGAFLALIVVHGRVRGEERRAAELAAVNDEAAARLGREWDRLPSHAESAPAGHAYAHDLDIVGHGSLMALLGTTGTGIGRARLRQWLLAPGPVDELRSRQEGVRDLVARLDFRQDLQVAGRLAGDPDRAHLDAFLAWAEEEPWLLRRPALRWASRLIPAATLTLAVLQLNATLARPWWLLTMLAGVILSGTVTKRIHRIFARASLGDAGLRHYADVVRTIQRESFDSERLRRARAALVDASDASDAGAELERLGWLTELAHLRHNGMFYLLVHWPTLWDFHVLTALERWQRRAGRRARAWVDAVGDLDALSALAAPPHDEPGWSFPTLGGDGEGDRLVAEGLAHPLLPAGGRVPNDVALGPPASFLMVTGSNMSGKSTLLRAIGTNAVLALAGGPVCARRLTMPAVDVYTSMRIEDSLERGVSLFMAELQRLKMVVDAADSAHDRPVLYLLDEILHGTNTAERQVAVREVVAHLLRSRAIGAISTHDLELAAAGALTDAVVPVHFQETVHPEGHVPPMSFDYVLRDGIATSTNALKLVRLVGLGRTD